ncbi:MAG: hypothetical protein O6837_04285 [Deltaproteobacteria bacterium]|nr:hypothetical protein [Deltaproteobacteria bacterium]
MVKTDHVGGTEKVEILKTLYPIFKREVFERRESIMRIATFGSGTLFAVLLLVTSRLLNFGRLRWLAILGLVIFIAGLIDQIKQQKVRHTQAKQGLIEIEKALQFFQENAYLPGKSLYPLDWQSPPRKDWGMAISTLSLVGLTVLIILAFVFV